MDKLGDRLADALNWKQKRGHVFWVQNGNWKLNIFSFAPSARHPGVVVYPDPVAAPGTSKWGRKRKNWKRSFSLKHPETLTGKPSTFFLALAKTVRLEELEGHVGCLHEEDLCRLDQALNAGNGKASER